MTKAAMVLMLNFFVPSPPVPTMSSSGVVAEVGPHLYSVAAHGRGAARDLVDGLAL